MISMCYSAYCPVTYVRKRLGLKLTTALHPPKSSQHVRACASRDGAICSKNRKIVPYHRDSSKTRNGARLRSPSPIMAPVQTRLSKMVSRAVARRATTSVDHYR